MFPGSCVRYHILRFQNTGAVHRTTRGPEPKLTSAGEDVVVDWIHKSAKEFNPLKPKLVRAKTKNFAELNGIDPDPVGGESWFEGFARRHPGLKERMPQELERRRMEKKTEAMKPPKRIKVASTTGSWGRMVHDRPRRDVVGTIVLGQTAL